MGNYFEMEQLAYEEMSFKDFFYFMLWWPFCSVEQNHFSNFDKGSPKKHFCEIILKTGHWSRRRCHLKFSSGDGTIFTILVDGHPRNISVKLF